MPRVTKVRAEVHWLARKVAGVQRSLRRYLKFEVSTQLLPWVQSDAL
jgi:hypothetical protein